MNKLKTFLLFASVFSFSVLSAQLKNTRWKTTLHIDGNATGVIMDFKDQTASIYTISDSSIIENMKYSKDATSFTVVKIVGQSDCDNTSPGIYGYTIKGDSMLLKLIKDDCADRYTVIQDTKWAKWNDYLPGVKVPVAILQTYVGVYEHDKGHPITISTDNNGILYAEGPGNGLPKSALTAISNSKFFLRLAGVEMDFIRDRDGKVVKLVSHEEKDFELKKIK